MSHDRTDHPFGDPEPRPVHLTEAARYRPEERGGDGFAELVGALRDLTAAVAGSAMPSDVSADIATRLRTLTATATEHQVPEPERFDGMRRDLPGRGHLVLPPYVVDSATDSVVRGRVVFGRHQLGGNGAVHGGVPPLLFDDLLGYAANFELTGMARTAYLHINYRAITPVGVELTFECRLDRREGRKSWATGWLRAPDGTLLIDAEALFVLLLPGQP